MTSSTSFGECSSCDTDEGADIEPSTLLQIGAQVHMGYLNTQEAAGGSGEVAGADNLTELAHMHRHRGANIDELHRNSSNVSSLLLTPYDLTELNVRIPRNYTGKKPLPLVVMLHGYSSYPSLYMKLYGLQDRVDEDQFIQVTPPGRKDNAGQRSWQAWGNKCGNCGSFSQRPCCGDGDVDHLRTIIFAVTRNLNVDMARIYVNGHSDGAAMAYRMACDAADVVAAIMILAGSPPEANWKPGYACRPSQPVSLLHIHGTADEDVVYEGSNHPPYIYKGAAGSAEFFASLNACNQRDGRWLPINATIKGKTGVQTTLRMSCGVDENNTEVFRSDGCHGGSDVELWKVIGSRHNPCFVKASYEKNSVSWLLRHRKLNVPSIAAPSCVDKPLGWEDSASQRCLDYAQNKWCNSTGGYGVGWKDSQGWFRDYAVKSVTAVTACCACGGGSKAITSR